MSRTDIFGPVEENSDENIEEEVEEEEKEEEPEEKEEKEEDSSRSEEKQGEADNDEPDPRRPLREKVGEDLEEHYMKEVQQFLDRKNPRLFRDCSFQYPITCKKKKATEDLPRTS